VLGRPRTQSRARPPAVLDDAPAHHRDLSSGGLRAAIFGVSDGLVSNVSLILGSDGADVSGHVVRLAGIAGLLGGAFSMAAGEYISMRAQREAFEHELEIERREIRDHPESERRELEGIYLRRGVAPDVARELTREIMSDPDVALDTHAREELGVDPSAFGSPVRAASSSFVSFAVGAFVPLAPFITGSESKIALWLAIGLTALGALIVGGSISYFTARSRVFSALRSLAFCVGAGGITYLVGFAIHEAH
jgi:vacuolar iron transporter family protein